MRTLTPPTTSTSSSLTGDYGRPPTYSSLVDASITRGPKVAQLCSMLGFAPDPEQRLVLDQTFAVDADGLPKASTVVIVAPRQNLKTAALQMMALGWLFVAAEKSVVWTAHEFSTAQKAFESPHGDGLAQRVERSPMLARRVRKVSRTNGDESIILRTDASLSFRARTRAGGRGLTADKVILDEAFALQQVQLGALVPTMMARPRGQIIVASSAPRKHSDVLRDYIERGRAGEPGIAYMEWCDPYPDQCGTEDCDHARTTRGCALDDLERLAAANTAYPHRITEASFRAARRAMSPREFAIEIMGWHEEPEQTTSDLTVEIWAAGVTQEAPSGRLVIAADTAPSHAWSSIAVVGGGVLELADRRRGSSWLPERLRDMCDRHGIHEVVLDPAGPIAGVIPDIEAAGVRVRMLTGAQAAAACGAFVESISQQRIKPRHADAFLSAVAGAQRRKAGDRWKWSRASSEVDISPLVAATWAAWAWLDDQAADYVLEESFY